MMKMIETEPNLNLRPQDISQLLPELAAYQAIYAPLFARREQREQAEKYLHGLLLDGIANKLVETMVLALVGDDGNAIRAMQQFVGQGAWQDEVILQHHWQEVDQDLGDEAGVLILDGRDFAKQGEGSVGVKRQWCGELGAWDAALQTYRQSLLHFQDRQDQEGEAEAWNNLGSVHLNRGRFADALSCFQKALDFSHQLDDLHLRSKVLSNMAVVQQQLGNLPEAIKTSQTCLNLCRQLKDQSGEVQIQHNLALLVYQQGNIEEAIGMLEVCWELYEALDQVEGVIQVSNNLGVLYKQRNEPDKALARYQTALKMTQRIGDEVGEATTLMNICRLYFAQGNYEQIPALAEPAWQLASKLELWDTAAKLCWLSGDLAFVSGDFQVCFYHYHYACVPASVYGDQLLQATIDRVESYLRQLPEQQASAFCQAFQQKPDAIDPTIWQPIQTYLYELETRLISQAAG